MRLGIIVLLAGAIGAAACGDDDADVDAEAQVRAVTSLEIFADMVRNVGGDRVVVDVLLPSGADPHTFELPPARVADIVGADIIFINGLALEETFEDLVMNNASGPVVELAEDLPVLGAEDDHDDHGHDDGEHAGGNGHAGDAHEEDDHHEDNGHEDGDDHADDGHEAGDDHHDHDHAEGNPHLWLDVRLAARYVERIRDELILIDPEGAEVYESNAADYLAELGELDREIEEAVDSIPEANRTLVTFHDAFPYFASRYGLDVVVAVASPGQEPSAQAIARLVEDIRDLPAVFKEPQFDAAVLERAAEDAGVRVLDLMSDAFIAGVDSYVEMMRFNMSQLLEGLGDE